VPELFRHSLTEPVRNTWFGVTAIDVRTWDSQIALDVR
jgi:hypothetical protein